MKELAILLLMYPLMVSSAMAVDGKAVSCGCYCGKQLPPPCSEEACKSACGYSSSGGPSDSGYNMQQQIMLQGAAAIGQAIGEWLRGNPEQEAAERAAREAAEAERERKRREAEAARKRKFKAENEELLNNLHGVTSSQLSLSDIGYSGELSLSDIGKSPVLFRDEVNALPAELIASFQSIDSRIRILYSKGVLNLTTPESKELARLEQERGRIWRTAVSNSDLSVSERQSLRLRLLTDSSEEVRYQPLPQANKTSSLTVRLSNDAWKAGVGAYEWADQKLAPYRGELPDDVTPLDWNDGAQKVMVTMVPP